MTLTDEEIHVWLVFDGDVRDGELRGYRSMLEPAEEARRDRLMAEPLRRQFLITRALQRSMLAQYAPGVAPRDWRFVEGAHGKPSLAPEFAALNLHFNVAHTAGLVALAVSRQAMLGVDVENIAARTTPVEIANRFFSEPEARDLARLPPADQPARFYALWTLKESWVKATGLGIASGLREVSFEFGKDDRATGVSMVHDDARRWAFWQARPAEEHALALAIRPESEATSGGVPRLQMWRCVPGLPSMRQALPAAARVGPES